MIETLFAFLGGSAFRMLFGEISAAWTKYQDHKHELSMIAAQSRVDAQRHAEQLEMVRVQADAGIQVIRVQGDADVARTEADAWLDAVRATSTRSGITWVDAWNSSIRPALATACVLLIVGDWVQAGFDLYQYNWTLISAVIGVFIGDRSLTLRGK